ncbi:MAG: hypothetical protein DME62_04695 [Verrucomicrobia bacterium]|nr:MAG: hypothetical protein DME62_04695 [Verrucomicrobiota bacterium]
MERPFAETSVVEFTVDARLETPGAGIGSERMLRRTKLGIAGALLGVPLRSGSMRALFAGT